jgi:hypothetical protein
MDKMIGLINNYKSIDWAATKLFFIKATLLNGTKASLVRE